MKIAMILRLSAKQKNALRMLLKGETCPNLKAIYGMVSRSSFGVTSHAVESYTRRFAKKKPPGNIKERIISELMEACEVWLKPEHRLTSLLAHNCNDARYYRKGGRIFVCANRVVVTVHNGEAEKWQDKPTKLN